MKKMRMNTTMKKYRWTEEQETLFEMVAEFYADEYLDERSKEEIISDLKSEYPVIPIAYTELGDDGDYPVQVSWNIEKLESITEITDYENEQTYVYIDKYDELFGDFGLSSELYVDFSTLVYWHWDFDDKPMGDYDDLIKWEEK